jgi:hypothetical protein
VQDLSTQLAALEAEKAEWEKEKTNFLLELNKLRQLKNETIERYDGLDKNDDVCLYVRSVLM